MKKFIPIQPVPLAAAMFLSAYACCLGIFQTVRGVPEAPDQPLPQLQIEPETTAITETTAPETTTLTEPSDVTPPVIEGVTDKTVYEGDTIAYRAGVRVTDDEDPAPKLKILRDDVDLSVPGEYTVTYVAQDASGNETEVTAQVTVLKKEEGYLSIEKVCQKVDDILQKIIEPDMTVEEQCSAIYIWMRNGRFGYNARAVHRDIYQSANDLLTQRTGDCYSYFTLSKLMFEQLGIPNIDVHKEKQYAGDSNHYWSLVSPDGGKSWYHFDATPRLGNAPNFCLVTDDFLDAYSDSHGGTHHRDKSLYPATPKKELSLPATWYVVAAPSTAPTEETTQPTTEETTQATTEETTQATTEGSTQPTTEGSTQPTTEGSTQPTTEGSTQPTTEGSTQPTTEGSTQATTEGSTQATTEGSTQATTEGSAQPAPEGSEQPAPEGSEQPSMEGTA